MGLETRIESCPAVAEIQVNAKITGIRIKVSGWEFLNKLIINYLRLFKGDFDPQR